MAASQKVSLRPSTWDSYRRRVVQHDRDVLEIPATATRTRVRQDATTGTRGGPATAGPSVLSARSVWPGYVRSYVLEPSFGGSQEPLHVAWATNKAAVVLQILRPRPELREAAVTEAAKEPATQRF